MDRTTKIIFVAWALSLLINGALLIYVSFNGSEVKPVIVNEDCTRAHINLNAGSYNSIYVDTEGHLLGKTEANIDVVERSKK